MDDVFIVWDNDKLEKKWISYAGERWRGLNTQLTMDYITNLGPNAKLPPKMHSNLDQETWDDFFESRNFPEYQVSSNVMLAESLMYGYLDPF